MQVSSVDTKENEAPIPDQTQPEAKPESMGEVKPDPKPVKQVTPEETFRSHFGIKARNVFAFPSFVNTFVSFWIDFDVSYLPQASPSPIFDMITPEKRKLLQVAICRNTLTFKYLYFHQNPRKDLRFAGQVPPEHP